MVKSENLTDVTYLADETTATLFIDMSGDRPLVRKRTKSIDHKIMRVQRDITISTSSCQLSRRKALFEKRRRISVCSLITALFGIIVMLVENELTSAGVYTKTSTFSVTLKTLISLSTLILISLILAYHTVRIKLFLIDNCANDWRIAMTWQRTIQIFIELLICAIHPIPGEYYASNIINENNNRKVSYDIVLSVPMFLRLFLVSRTMLLHFKTFRDVSSQSIFALNRINFDIRFLLKTLMIIYPGTSLLIFIISLWGIAAWTLRQCERFYDEEHINYLDAIWLIIITFLTIGYGDVIPKTYCGRSTVVFIGMMSTGCAALLVAVISKKLELTKAEQHVHNFMMNTQLSNMLKNAAANVLRERWLIYKYTNLVKNHRVRVHQRQFYAAIYEFRQVKRDLQKLLDNVNALKVLLTFLIEIPRTVNDQLLSIEDQISSLQTKLEVVLSSLSRCTHQHFESMKKELNCVHSDILNDSVIVSQKSCLCQKPLKRPLIPML